MLWLLLIVLVGGLLLVMFHKPSVNPAGAGWTAPAPRAPVGATDVSVKPEAASQPLDVNTFDLNDLYASRPKQPPTDHPHA